MSQPIVTVFGQSPNGRWHLAGFARLELPRLLSALPSLEATLAEHPQIVGGLAHITWIHDGHQHAELIEITATGPIGSWQGSEPGLGLELALPSGAPPLHLPPGPGSDGFWCVLFPWASFCS